MKCGVSHSHCTSDSIQMVLGFIMFTCVFGQGFFAFANAVSDETYKL